MPGQTRFLQVHDVFAAARRGPNENQPAENRGAFPRHLLSDPSAERESEDVAIVQPQAVQEIQCMRRHSGDRGGHLAGGLAYACAIEQDDLTP